MHPSKRLIDILSFALGLIGVAIGVHQGYFAREEFKPMFFVGNTRIVADLSAVENVVRLRASENDSLVATSIVGVSTLYFWNAGKKTIVAETGDITEPLALEIEGGSLLGAILLRVSRPAAGIALTVSEDKSEAGISLERLAHGDGASYLLVYEIKDAKDLPKFTLRGQVFRAQAELRTESLQFRPTALVSLIGFLFGMGVLWRYYASEHSKKGRHLAVLGAIAILAVLAFVAWSQLRLIAPPAEITPTNKQIVGTA